MYDISMITGDGIGPEISESVCAILDEISSGTGPELAVKKLLAGDAALYSTGSALPDSTIQEIKKSDACLKAPVGESAADVIVVLRRILDLYANVRPAKSYPGMPALNDKIDMVVVRENTEDLYTGDEFEVDTGAVALRIITKDASKRIAKHAFETARLRAGKKKVTCVHKSNVMRITDGLFSKSCAIVAKDYPDIELEQMYVDACAMNLIRRPESFDVIVTTNLFGDILSDESSQAAGGIGMAPAANIGDDFALFEPVHGAAFDIAGSKTANPTSFILSAAMMLDWLARKYNDDRCKRASSTIQDAVRDIIQDGIKTKDVGGNLTTDEFTDELISKIRSRLR